MKNTNPPNRALELTGLLAAWLIPLIVYLGTIAPCVTAGDAGEFMVAVHRFSLPHPPGYPLYMVLLKLWTSLPFGLGPDPVAFQTNLFSVVMMTLMCGFFYRLARTLTGSAAASLAATLSLAFSRTLWKFALVTEVYSLHLLLTVLVLLGLAVAREGKKPWGLVLTAFAFGLGLAHHHTILFLLPMIIFLWPRGIFKKGAPVILIIAGFILPLAFYLFLPMMASNTPRYAESGFTAGNFVDIVTRAEYRERAHYENAPSDQTVRPINILARAGRYLPRQFGWILLAASIVGWFFAPSGKRLWAFWSAITAVGYIFAVAYLSRGSPLGMPLIFLRSVDEFLLPVNVFLALGLAWILTPAAKALEARTDLAGTEGQNYIRPEYIPIMIMFLLCVLPLLQGMANARWSNMTHHTFAQDQAWNVLMQTPENGVLVVSGDESFLHEYLQEVRSFRTDVTLKIWPFRYVVGERMQDPVESLKLFLTLELGDRGCVFTFGDAQEAVDELSPPKALRLDGVGLTLVDRYEGGPNYIIGDPNIWTTYQLRNLDPDTLGRMVPDDFEYEVFDRYINGLNASVAWLDARGYGRDPSYEVLQKMAKQLSDSLAQTGYLKPGE